MRWLAIQLPDLPMEVHTRGLSDPLPIAVVERGRGDSVLLCNEPAAARGVHPGQPLGGALALAADLRALPRQAASERAALERLAAWCGRFTPVVSLAPPQALVLEVAGSLRLFGGAPALIGQVRTGLSDLGYRSTCCLAPTPGGALVLAARGWEAVIGNLTALRAAIVELPLPALGLAPRPLEDLRRMGLRRVGELLRLPRAGLAERFGPALVARLQRLLGEAPDPRRCFTPPPQYLGRIELPAELVQVEGLSFPCRRLIEELSGYLAARECGTQRLLWRLVHAQTTDSGFTLGTARPERDPQRWLGLLRERLERLDLPAPVRAIVLRVRDIRPLPPVSLALFPQLDRPSAPDPSLLDRLSARLGRAAVRGLALAADHRPERAWRWCAPGEPTTGGGRTDRPLWLLPEPLPLQRSESPGNTFAGGEPGAAVIRFQAGQGAFEIVDLGGERERIETGWWDDQQVARDYFVATTAEGERLWLYRECGGRRGWFLHGLFG
jgi:protein ImuB